MVEYLIDVGIPMPPPIRGGIRKAKPREIEFPFEKMQPGVLDSFLIKILEPGPTGNPLSDLVARNQWRGKVMKARSRIASAELYFRAETGIPKFHVAARQRTMREHGESGLRVWRVL